MACALPSADLLAMLLAAAGNDPDVSVEQALERLEAYEAQRGCCYGAERGDVRRALYGLGLSLEWWGYEWDELPARLEGMPLRQWVEPILRYDAVYCNDEGEYWEEDTSAALPCNLRLRALFSGPEGIAALARFGPDGILERTPCSEPACGLETCWRRGWGSWAER